MIYLKIHTNNGKDVLTLALVIAHHNSHRNGLIETVVLKGKPHRPVKTQPQSILTRKHGWGLPPKFPNLDDQKSSNLCNYQKPVSLTSHMQPIDSLFVISRPMAKNPPSNHTSSVFFQLHFFPFNYHQCIIFLDFDLWSTSLWILLHISLACILLSTVLSFMDSFSLFLCWYCDLLQSFQLFTYSASCSTWHWPAIEERNTGRSHRPPSRIFHQCYHYILHTFRWRS
jgi:hypothetical protein